MKNNLLIVLLACVVLSIVPLSLANPAPDQGHAEERVFHHPKVEVEKVIQELHATMNGRLPTLDDLLTLRTNSGIASRVVTLSVRSR